MVSQPRGLVTSGAEVGVMEFGELLPRGGGDLELSNRGTLFLTHFQLYQ